MPSDRLMDQKKLSVKRRLWEWLGVQPFLFSSSIFNKIVLPGVMVEIRFLKVHYDACLKYQEETQFNNTKSTKASAVN